MQSESHWPAHSWAPPRPDAWLALLPWGRTACTLMPWAARWPIPMLGFLLWPAGQAAAWAACGCLALLGCWPCVGPRAPPVPSPPRLAAWAVSAHGTRQPQTVSQQAQPQQSIVLATRKRKNKPCSWRNCITKRFLFPSGCTTAVLGGFRKIFTFNRFGFNR